MARYRKIEVSIHNEEWFQGLSDMAKLLWFTLYTHPQLTSMGAMRATIPGLAAELGWTVIKFRKALDELIRLDVVRISPDAPFLCFPHFLNLEPPDSPNMVKSWKKFRDLFPDCELKSWYFRQVSAFLEGLGEAFVEPFRQEFPEGFQEGYSESENREHGSENNPPLVPSTGDDNAEVASISNCQIGPEPFPSQGASEGPASLSAGKDRFYSDDFEDFWNAYPPHRRTGGKEKAYRHWQHWKKAGKLPPLAELLEILKQLEHSEDWQKEGGRFVPMITSWLRAGRWTDVQSKIHPATESCQADHQCPHCLGRGILIVEEEGRSYGKPCSCRSGQKIVKE
ncbi:MAG: hypothetical protein QW835_07640 [Candidatus Hadarchaeum sp.]